ncbi:outer membrane protein OmpA [Minicystis rosea]|nr:outer membrane protein OmpA [Minicystis rosea]
MLPRRSLPRCALGFGIAAAVGLGSPALLAQTPPAAPPAPAAPPEPAAAPPQDEPIRFTFDVHGGFTYRVGSVTPEPDARGGGLVGVDALIGTNKWWQAGIGYDHGFLGTERLDNKANGTFLDRGHALEQLWALGRIYPWSNDAVGIYLQLGIGPAWQRVSDAGISTVVNGAGQVQQVTRSCRAYASPGLGLRGGAGVDVALTNALIFFGEVGVDHFRLTDKQIGDCDTGTGPATFLATRFGIAFVTGRTKPPPPPAPPPPPSDRDGDAILDNVDACPDQPGLPNTDPTKNGCPPPPDKDHDGVPDASDACPDVAGPPSDDPKKNGCPDKDGDKIIDPLDACPDVPGRASEDPKENGCPPDTDGDGIRDDKDACPEEKGLPNEDPAKHGCPLVVVREQEIVITQQVQFEVDRANIKKESDELLETVAKVMKDHPELARIEVQGHSDNSGAARHNKTLSQQRADSVKKALVKRGVEDRRLVAKGYGEEKPIADNATEAGKAKNRRVQFVILEKKAPTPKAEKPAKAAAPAPKKKK